MSKERFFAALPFTINDSNLRPFVILVNDELKTLIEKYYKILREDENLGNLTIGHTVVDASVILLSGYDTDFSMDFTEEINSIVNSIDAPNPDIEISDIMDIELFEEWMYAPELNASENTQLILTVGGLYFTCQFETEFIESPMLDFEDLGIEV
jgi:hypothetical protein